MDQFTIVTVIGRPVEDVFAAMVDTDRMPLWTPGLSEVRITGDGPLAAGSTLVCRVTFLGRSFESQVVCTNLTENKNFATKSTAGPIYLETDAVLEPVAEGTRMTVTYRGESRGFFKLAEPLVVRQSKRYWETAAENLRALLEDHAL
jgi:uncharacterized protein YndB with AHSA1/START domain